MSETEFQAFFSAPEVNADFIVCAFHDLQGNPVLEAGQTPIINGDAAGVLRALSEQGLLIAFVDVVTDASDDTLAELEHLVCKKRSQQK